ncbi:MAG TPA: MFS transporter [Acetobacteraceae bacterium]|nr:MFS transporter [Acetobacteraceae bacterium]
MPTSDPAAISARLDRLPPTRSVWRLVALLSMGGFFEFYDLFFTAYVAPGLIRSGLYTASTKSFFGITGFASFVAAFFAGLFVGTLLFGFIADRYGRRLIFTVSLLWYTVCTIVMALQFSAEAINLWRFLAGIGIGVELVTIDTYIAELVPRHLRGRAFAVNQLIQFSVVPIVAALSWLLVPRAPLGFDGWRWVVLIGAGGAIAVWWIRRGVPESPRWLAQQGRLVEAERITAALEARVAAEYGAPLPPPTAGDPVVPRGHFGEIWRPPYLRRTIMLIVFNVFQTVGFYGFGNWVPTLLIAEGVTITHSLAYTFVIAIASPFGPLLGYTLADRIERKWQIVMAACGVAVFGLIFAGLRSAPAIIVVGIALTLANNIMSFAFHAYQAELYPTRVRALAVGFVYSWSRLSVVFMAFVIAFTLGRFGPTGVFVLIAGSMGVVMLAIGALGPRTRHLPLEVVSR